MALKPAIGNIGRPQGFIDDAAKAALKAVKGLAKRNPNFKGSIMPKKGGIPRKKFEKIYGPVERNPRFASPQELAKVQQQIARSKTKRRSMAQTTRMADKYYGK
jgi:hypothetical protein